MGAGKIIWIRNGVGDYESDVQIFTGSGPRFSISRTSFDGWGEGMHASYRWTMIDNDDNDACHMPTMRACRECAQSILDNENEEV